MKKLFSLILGLILFSFSNTYAIINAEISEIYSTKLIENSGIITYTFDVEIPSRGRSPGDYVRFNLRPNDWDIFNKYEFTNTKVEVIEGSRRSPLEVAFPVENEKVKNMKVRIEGNVVASYLANVLKDVWLVIGDLNGNGETVRDWVTKDFFRYPNILKIKVDQHMDLGKAYPGGKLSTKDSGFGGKPAEIKIELDNIQNGDNEITLTIKDEGKVNLYGDGQPMIANVWFRDEGNSNSQLKEINKKLIKNDNSYKTEVIRLDGNCLVPLGQTKGIYRGTIRVRVTYGK